MKESTLKLYQSKINKLASLNVTDLNDTAKVIQAVQSISDNLNTQKT